MSFNIKYREENNIKINDVINLLMQARRDGTIEVENDKAYENAGFATVMEHDGIKKDSMKISSRLSTYIVLVKSQSTIYDALFKIEIY